MVYNKKVIYEATQKEIVDSGVMGCEIIRDKMLEFSILRLLPWSTAGFIAVLIF